MRTLVMGDIHGAYKALLQCLERSGFDYENDQLIQLGDVVDGYPQSHECVEELLKIKHLVALKGNHDEWFREFIEIDFHPYYWTYGGKGTLISYLEHAGKKGSYFATGSGFKTSLVSADIPSAHRQFFNDQQLYYIDSKKRCFIHAGFDRHLPFYDQKESTYYWNRDLWTGAMEHKEKASRNEKFVIKTKFKEIYIGHTPTTKWGKDKPIQTFHIINMDTGAGHSGRLTILEVDTKEFWQSDPLPELYAENFRD